jgi:tRNA U34 5-carboxymethylaminomethyl modifying enzyme MnmG/GidA
MQDILLNYPNLRLVEASVEDIIFDDSEKLKGIKIQDGTLNTASHVLLKWLGAVSRDNYLSDCNLSYCISSFMSVQLGSVSGREILANRVVITTGTFLRGTCYLGRTSYPAGIFRSLVTTTLLREAFKPLHSAETHHKA